MGAPIVAAVALLATLTLAQDAGKPANLVVSGGFDQGPEPGGFKTYTTKDKLPGWTVAKGSVDVIGTYFKCPHGRCLDLNGNNNGAIRQSLATEPGKKYKLSFALSANPQCGEPKKVLRVSAGKQSQQFTITYNPAIPWTKRSWEFTADA